jgi:hypothetical protein
MQSSDCAGGNICCINPGRANVCTTQAACNPTVPPPPPPSCTPYGNFVDVGEEADCTYPFRGVTWNVEITCKARDGTCVHERKDRQVFAHHLPGDTGKVNFVENVQFYEGDFCGATFTWEQQVYLRTDNVSSASTFEAGTWKFVDKDHFDWDSTVTDSGCNLLYRCTGHGARDASPASSETCSDFTTSLGGTMPAELTHSRCDGSGPAYSAPHLGGEWHQSYVCTSVLDGTEPWCCERVDDDRFTLFTGYCALANEVKSPDHLADFQGTYSAADKRVTWSGTNEKGTPTESFESGQWFFSDANNFTSTSTYSVKGTNASGRCVANGRRGAVAPPVAAPAACTGKPPCY